MKEGRLYWTEGGHFLWWG